MQETSLKGTLAQGELLIDEIGLVYKLLEVASNYVVAEPYPNPQCLGCDVMSYAAMEEEGWCKFNVQLTYPENS